MPAEPDAAHVAHDAAQLPARGTVLEACYSMDGDALATTSSDDVLQVWMASESGWQLVHTEQLPAHPTRVAWARPQQGQLLAVGTTTGQVHIVQGPTPGSIVQQPQPQLANPKSQQQPQCGSRGWCCTAQLRCGYTTVSALAFAPHQVGVVLAAACGQQQAAGVAHGSLTASGGNAHVQLWEASGCVGSCTQWTLVSNIELSQAAGSCHCLCWRESTPGLPPLLLGGHDAGGCIWAYHSPNMKWQELGSFSAPAGASSAALSVHWAPALGRPFELIAASFGDVVVLFKVQQSSSSSSSSSSSHALGGQGQLGQLEVLQVQELVHPSSVWKLEFNMMGTTLACSLDDRPEVWLWMPSMVGRWAAVSKVAGQQQATTGAAMID